MSESETITTAVGSCLLHRSGRRTLGISVLPDGSVELVAPRVCKDEAIQERVRRRAGWIRRQQRFFRELNGARTPLRYASGATHRYLGRQYRLKVWKIDERSVKLRGGFFQIGTPDTTEATVRTLLEDWMREHATVQFSRRLVRWKTWCAHRKLPEPRLQLRRMKKRWGSALSDGRIILNPDLVRMPSPCIDYVIAHEICHLRHPAHNKAFFRLLSEMVPEWMALKLRLEMAEQ